MRKRWSKKTHTNTCARVHGGIVPFVLFNTHLNRINESGLGGGGGAQNRCGRFSGRRGLAWRYLCRMSGYGVVDNGPWARSQRLRLDHKSSHHRGQHAPVQPGV